MLKILNSVFFCIHFYYNIHFECFSALLSEHSLLVLPPAEQKLKHVCAAHHTGLVGQ